MSWVRQTTTAGHECELPMATIGTLDDLYRCGTCRRLWRIGKACEACDFYGQHPSGGHCTVGRRWRHARLGQRLRHWRSR